MAAQKGRDLLLRIDAENNQTFITIAGIRTRKMRFNSGVIETTDSQSEGQWRELLSGGGIKTLTISGEGIFKDAQSDTALRVFAFSGESVSCQIDFPDFGVFEGLFQIPQLDYTGLFNREISFDITLESAGEITFTEDVS